MLSFVIYDNVPITVVKQRIKANVPPCFSLQEKTVLYRMLLQQTKRVTAVMQALRPPRFPWEKCWREKHPLGAWNFALAPTQGNRRHVSWNAVIKWRCQLGTMSSSFLHIWCVTKLNRGLSIDCMFCISDSIKVHRQQCRQGQLA